MNLKLRNFLKYWLPVILFLGLIFFFSSRPTPTVSAVDWGDFLFKKTIHFFEFGTLSLLFYRVFHNTTSWTIKKVALWAIVLTVLYAVSDEFHQSFIIGRTATVRDVMIDITGAIFALISLWKLLPKAPEKLKTWVKKLDLI
jgi:VanZ family protein